MGALDIQSDYLATFSAYENQVTKRLPANGYPGDRIINLRESKNPGIEEMLKRLVEDIPAKHVLLIGLVNNDARQAEMLLHYFERRLAAAVRVPVLPLNKW